MNDRAGNPRQANALHVVIKTRHDEIMRRWKAAVQGKLAPEAMSSIELVNHLPTFLSEVSAALRADVGLASAALPPDETRTASEHGEQRLRLGFAVDSVVREYGALRDAILVVAKDAGATISVREHQTLFDAIVTGIAHAVSEYARQRDADVQRQHDEHFAFIAHELRNPLAAAMMALGQLKRRREIQTDAPATGTVERGLLRMQELIDHSLALARVASTIELRLERTKLEPLLNEAATYASSMAEESGIGLRVRIQEDDDVDLDLRLVRSTLNNLVGHAVRSTPSGGVVELRASVSGGRATMAIEDGCGGLPPGAVEEAFAPSGQVDGHETGHELSLVIAKQAVDAHGGTIRLQNLPGKGCVFALEFPIASSTPHA